MYTAVICLYTTSSLDTMIEHILSFNFTSHPVNFEMIFLGKRCDRRIWSKYSDC
jgi:hypothetical protein